jgi:pilin isopeptide linkage protein
LIVLLTSTVNTTFGFIVTKTDSLINTFVPFDNIISNLLISKNVEHPFGDEYVIPDNIVFDFKVDFGSLYAKTTIKTTTGDIVADKNGSIQISVKPGEFFAAYGIDAGTKVTVTEIQKDGSGFTVKDSAATMEGIVAEDGSLKFEYVNIYTPASVQPVNLSVVGTKILEGREWQSGDTFAFALEQKQNDGTWTVIGTKAVTYDARNTAFNQFDFSDLIQALTFDKVGTYNFRMTEVIGNLENVDYDKSVNTFDIKVTDVDMDGKLEVSTVTAAQNAKVTETDGKYKVNITFNNTFIPVVSEPDDIEVNIGVNKTIKNTGVSSIGPAGFEFVLENTVSGEKRALKSDDKGTAVFTLPFTVADVGKTYTYKLFETNDGMTGVTYDTKVYDISIAITLNSDNKLVSTITMDGKAVNDVVVRFENTYYTDQATAPPTGDDSNVTFWFIMMIISGTTCIVLVLLEKRYTRSKS